MQYVCLVYQEEEKLAAGAWVGSLLFMVVLAAGVALLMLTLFPHELLDELIQRRSDEQKAKVAKQTADAAAKPAASVQTDDADLSKEDQAALKWLLAEPTVVTTLPNIYDLEQLEEFATASEKPDLSAAQMQRVGDIAAHNFGVEEEPMSYKGTMQRATA